MPQSKRDIILKTMHKTNGILFELNDINDTMLNVVISKKTRYIRFLAYGEIAIKVKSNFKIKDRIKVFFYAISKKYKERWYTDLVVYDVVVWEKKKKKIASKQSQMEFQDELEQILPPKFDWDKELDKFNKAIEKK